MFGGWSLAGITALTSGRFVNVSVRGNPTSTGVNADRPNALRAWHFSHDQRTLDGRFDTDAFAPNEPFMVGNAGRNLIEGPGLANFDFALSKNFNLTESKNLQFRWEAFNLSDIPQLTVSNLQVGTGSLGQINRAGRPRDLQFGLKFIYR